ncbi:MAG: spore maturation protein [Clostridiaceae bacterium]|jgi:spore maturation protein B|nr:spore maturation protein [Clostridiaceae bacterium]
MSLYLLPAFIFILLGLSAIKQIKVYDCFVDGSKEALKLMVTVFPYIAAISIAIELFRVSGLGHFLSGILAVPLSYVGIPSEIAELMMLVPVSGNGAIALLENVFKIYGADSYIGRCAAAVVGSSETIFYISAVYFSGTDVKKLRYAIPVALFSSFCGAIIACLLCRFI